MTANGSPGGIGCLKLSEKGSGGTVNNATTNARLRQTLYDDIRTGRLSPGEAICRICKIVAMTQPEYARLPALHRVLMDIGRAHCNPRLSTMQKLPKPFGLQVGFVAADDSGDEPRGAG